MIIYENMIPTKNLPLQVYICIWYTNAHYFSIERVVNRSFHHTYGNTISREHTRIQNVIFSKIPFCIDIGLRAQIKTGIDVLLNDASNNCTYFYSDQDKMFFIMYEYGKCRTKVLPNPEENEMVRVIKNIQNKQEIKHPDHTDF